MSLTHWKRKCCNISYRKSLLTFSNNSDTVKDVYNSCRYNDKLYSGPNIDFIYRSKISLSLTILLISLSVTRVFSSVKVIPYETRTVSPRNSQKCLSLLFKEQTWSSTSFCDRLSFPTFSDMVGLCWTCLLYTSTN